VGVLKIGLACPYTVPLIEAPPLSAIADFEQRRTCAEQPGSTKLTSSSPGDREANAPDLWGPATDGLDPNVRRRRFASASPGYTS
jgi:hypothetical protein